MREREERCRRRVEGRRKGREIEAMSKNVKKYGEEITRVELMSECHKL